MQTNTNSYFSHLVNELNRYLHGLLSEEGFGFFRRGPDFQFHLVGHEIGDTDKGIFNAERPEGRILVFRNPAKITAKFVLASQSFAPEAALRAYDKLTTHFFDHRTIEAILPPAFDAIPELKQRLQSGKAELRHLDSKFTTGETSTLPFRFLFSYSALFHSGSLLREETRTRSRIIDYGKTLSERSV